MTPLLEVIYNYLRDLGVLVNWYDDYLVVEPADRVYAAIFLEYDANGYYSVECTVLGHAIRLECSDPDLLTKISAHIKCCGRTSHD